MAMCRLRINHLGNGKIVEAEKEVIRYSRIDDLEQHRHSEDPDLSRDEVIYGIVYI